MEMVETPARAALATSEEEWTLDAANSAVTVGKACLLEDPTCESCQ